MPEIFISYSHQDEVFLGELRHFLVTLQRTSKIRWWSDERIEGASYWGSEISDAIDRADLAILLVSQRFLSSSFIWENELPHILKREHHGGLKVLPVFVRTSTVDSTPVPFTTEVGERLSKLLTVFQGANSPAKPLNILATEGEREAVYRTIAEIATRLLQDYAVLSPTSGLHRTQDVRLRDPIDELAESDRIFVRYALISNQLRHEVSTDGLEFKLLETLDWSRVLANLDALLEWHRAATLQGRDHDFVHGHAIFSLLFGSGARVQRLFSRLNGTPERSANPLEKPKQLYIVTDVPVLQHLPWSLCAYNQQRLTSHRWLIMTAASAKLSSSSLGQLPTLLCIAPTTHAAEIERLKALWVNRTSGRNLADYFRVHSTLDGLGRCFASFRPNLVYITGMLLPAPAGAGVLMDDRALLDATKLAACASEYRERAIILLFDGTPQAGMSFSIERAAPGHQLAEAADVVVWRHAHELERDGAKLLESLITADFPKLEGVDAVLYRIHTTLGTFSAAKSGVAAPVRFAKHHLDRIMPKSWAKRIIDAHCENSDQRVLCLIGHGSEQKRHVGSLSAQLLTFLRDENPKLPMSEPLIVGATCLDEAGCVEDFTGQMLSVSPQDMTLRECLNGHTANVRRVVRSNELLLWVDWGIVRAGDGLRDRLTNWLLFNCETLLPQCPGNLKIVSYVSVEQLEDSAVDVESLRDTIKESLHILSIGIEVLPELDLVPRREVELFLATYHPTVKPIVPDLLRAIMGEKKSMEFGDILPVLERGETHGWRTLLNELRTR